MTSIAEVIQFLEMCTTANLHTIIKRLDDIERRLDNLEHDTEGTQGQLDDLISTLHNI